MQSAGSPANKGTGYGADAAGQPKFERKDICGAHRDDTDGDIRTRNAGHDLINRAVSTGGDDHIGFVRDRLGGNQLRIARAGGADNRYLPIMTNQRRHNLIKQGMPSISCYWVENNGEFLFWDGLG